MLTAPTAIHEDGAITTSRIETAIAQIDARLPLGGAVAELYNDRGQFLELLGRRDEAVEAYVNVLRVEPTNVDALTALGLMTLAIGNRAGARTLLAGAVLHGPRHARAHANLAFLSAQDDQSAAARILYDRALELEPGLASAHHGLAQLLDRQGDSEGAARHRSLGLRHRPLTIERYLGESEPIRILALSTEAHGNIPTFGYFDNRTFLLATLTVEHAAEDIPLPPHDLVFNAIGEADLCPAQLRKAQAFVRRSNAPVINDPSAVAATSRVANARRLREVPGVKTARMIALPRAQILAAHAADILAEQGFVYPLLVRAPGYHTGEHFVKVDCAANLRGAVATLPGDDILVIEYLNVAGSTGVFCKYRVIVVDGTLYPLHLATAHTWKVHYFSADMSSSADNRLRDEAFVTDMQAVLGTDVVATLERVRDVLGLDFGGIDFALDAAGDVIVFEANASMVVPPPERGAMWDYRREPVARIQRAVRDMLVERAVQRNSSSIP